MSHERIYPLLFVRVDGNDAAGWPDASARNEPAASLAAPLTGGDGSPGWSTSPSGPPRLTIAPYPVTAKATSPWNQGFELWVHVSFTTTTATPIYFCDPRAPWQRGSK